SVGGKPRGPPFNHPIAQLLSDALESPPAEASRVGGVRVVRAGPGGVPEGWRGLGASGRVREIRRGPVASRKVWAWAGCCGYGRWFLVSGIFGVVRTIGASSGRRPPRRGNQRGSPQSPQSSGRRGSQRGSPTRNFAART